MISGAFARAFRSAVQPVEIAAALQRECDNNAQILCRDRRMVPNDFHVELSPTDLDRLRRTTRALAQELTTSSRTTPTRSATSSRARSAIAFETAEDLTTGRFRIRSRAQAQVTGNDQRTRTRSPRARAARGQRHPAPAAARPAWWSGAAPRPTSASTTPASAAGTSSSWCSHRRRVERGRDLGSTNGMLVDGTEGRAGPRLRDGTTVKIGNTDDDRPDRRRSRRGRGLECLS